MATLNTPDNNYAWWIGQDGNIWANVNGNVKKMGQGSMEYTGQGGTYFNAVDLDNPTSGGASLYAKNQIADPNVPAANNTANSVVNTATRGASGSGISAAEQALKNRMIGIYDRQIGDINSNIDSLNSQLQNKLDALKGEYNQYKNEQQSAYNSAKNDYDNSTKQNQQNLQTNRNDITNRASSGLRGLLRVLGAMGAGGGSVARYEAPSMVTKQANQEYSNAGRTYAQNQSSLDTDWGNYNNEFENDKKKLEDWYSGQIKAKKQENEERKQSLLADLVTAFGNRAQYGGDYGNNINDAYNRIAASRNQINELGKYTPANYTGVTAVYKTPDLASYNANNTNLTTAVTDSNTSASAPLLTALRGLNKKKNNSPYSNIVED